MQLSVLFLLSAIRAAKFASSHHNATHDHAKGEIIPQKASSSPPIAGESMPAAPALISHLVVPIYEEDFVTSLQAMIGHWRAHPPCNPEQAGEGKSLVPHLGLDGKSHEQWRFDQTELTIALVSGSLAPQLLAVVPLMFEEVRKELGGCFHRVNLLANRAVKIDRELDGLEGSRRKLHQALVRGGMLQPTRVPLSNALVLEPSMVPVKDHWLDALFLQLHGQLDGHADSFWLAADWHEDRQADGQLGLSALTHLSGAYLLNLAADCNYPSLLASLANRHLKQAGKYADGTEKRVVQSPSLQSAWVGLQKRFLHLDWAPTAPAAAAAAQHYPEAFLLPLAPQ